MATHDDAIVATKENASGEMYAELGDLAAGNGQHHLAADMYLAAIAATLGGPAQQRRYLVRANEERLKGYGVAPGTWPAVRL